MAKKILPTRTKVKTGCKTCKLRRVKCDEGKPACRRCQSSGRVCSGYGVWGGGSDSSDRQSTPGSEQGLLLPAPSQPVHLMLLSTSERYCFEWYMCQSSKKLPGAFPADSWTSLLFQASTSEPAIRHAMLALGSAHFDEVQRAVSHVPKSKDEQPLVTVRQYNKAIENLLTHFTNKSKASIRVTAISCALFINMEFLLGNYTQGLLHLKHGLGLLRELGNGIEEEDPSSFQLDGWVVTIFTRLLVQARLLGQATNFPCRSLLGPVIKPKTDTFTNIHQARRCLEHLMLRTFDLQDRWGLQTSMSRPELESSMLECQNNIKIELKIWIRMHGATVARLPSSRALMNIFTSYLSPARVLIDSLHPPVPQALMDSFAYSLLRIYHSVATVLASTCIDYPNEMAFDRHESDFLSILSQSMEVSWIRSLGGTVKFNKHHGPNGPNSTADMGWIPPLYFTAVKCRNHRIRHQALKLLQSSLHKEGIWNAPLVIAVARQIIELEESNFYDHLGGLDFDKREHPTVQDLSTAPLPETFRFSDLKIILPDDPAGNLKLSCGRKTSQGTTRWMNKDYDLGTKQWTTISGST